MHASNAKEDGGSGGVGDLDNQQQQQQQLQQQQILYADPVRSAAATAVASAASAAAFAALVAAASARGGAMGVSGADSHRDRAKMGDGEDVQDDDDGSRAQGELEREGGGAARGGTGRGHTRLLANGYAPFEAAAAEVRAAERDHLTDNEYGSQGYGVLDADGDGAARGGTGRVDARRVRNGYAPFDAAAVEVRADRAADWERGDSGEFDGPRAYGALDVDGGGAARGGTGGGYAPFDAAGFEAPGDSECGYGPVATGLSRSSVASLADPALVCSSALDGEALAVSGYAPFGVPAGRVGQAQASQRGLDGGPRAAEDSSPRPIGGGRRLSMDRTARWSAAQKPPTIMARKSFDDDSVRSAKRGSVGSDAKKLQGLDFSELEDGFDEEFQVLMRIIKPDETVLKEKEADTFIRLARLVRDFQHGAVTYGKVIIAEKHLADEKKSIRPVTSAVGGFAGGEKFICGNIFFRFPLDNHNLYGSEEFAAKEANHQLKGLTALYNADVELHLPLLAVIDYHGYKLVAMSVLPLQGNATLCYGSSDGGANLCEPRVLRPVELAAEALNLAKHPVVTRDALNRVCERWIHMPCDMEVHRVERADGETRLYVVDFARLFPPQPPRHTLQRLVRQAVSSWEERRPPGAVPGGAVCDDSPAAAQPAQQQALRDADCEVARGSHLVHMLRPELVRGFAKPLSSDAFSRFVSQRDAHRHFNEDVTEAAAHLVQAVIPQLAASISKQPLDLAKLAEEAQGRELAAEVNKVGNTLTNQMHRQGVNMRFLGVLFNAVSSSEWRREILLEATARLVKALIRAEMRRAPKQVRTAVLSPYVSSVARLLNQVLGMTPCCYSAARANASKSHTAPRTTEQTKHLCSACAVGPVQSRSCSCRCAPGCPQRRESHGAELAPADSTGSDATGRGSGSLGSIWSLSSSSGSFEAERARQEEEVKQRQAFWCFRAPQFLKERFFFGFENAGDFRSALARLEDTRIPKPSCYCCVCLWKRCVPPARLFARLEQMCSIVLTVPAQRSCDQALRAVLSAWAPATQSSQRTGSSENGASRSSPSSWGVPGKPGSGSGTRGRRGNRHGSSKSSHTDGSLNGASVGLSGVIEGAGNSSGRSCFDLLVPFQDNDVVDLVESCKVLPIMEFAQGTSAIIRHKMWSKAGNREEAAHMLNVAKERFTAGLDICPSDHRLLCNLGMALEENEDRNGALEKYLQSVKSNPKHARSWYFLARLLALWFRSVDKESNIAAASAKREGRGPKGARVAAGANGEEARGAQAARVAASVIVEDAIRRILLIGDEAAAGDMLKMVAVARASNPSVFSWPSIEPNTNGRQSRGAETRARAEPVTIEASSVSRAPKGPDGVFEARKQFCKLIEDCFELACGLSRSNRDWVKEFANFYNYAKPRTPTTSFRAVYLYERVLELDPTHALARKNLALRILFDGEDENRIAKKIARRAVAKGLQDEASWSLKHTKHLTNARTKFENAAKHYVLLLEAQPDHPMFAWTLAKANLSIYVLDAQNCEVLGAQPDAGLLGESVDLVRSGFRSVAAFRERSEVMGSRQVRLFDETNHVSVCDGACKLLTQVADMFAFCALAVVDDPHLAEEERTSLHRTSVEVVGELFQCARDVALNEAASAKIVGDAKTQNRFENRALDLMLEQAVCELKLVDSGFCFNATANLEDLQRARSSRGSINAARVVGPSATQAFVRVDGILAEYRRQARTQVSQRNYELFRLHYEAFFFGREAAATPSRTGTGPAAFEARNGQQRQ